jgi:chemotaxis protein MotB
MKPVKLIFLLTLAAAVIPMYGSAQLFYTPGEYNSLLNTKVALELELKSLNSQYANEKKNLQNIIKNLEGRIENLNRQIELLEKKNREESELCSKKISELEKRTDILKEKSSETEKELIDENRRLQQAFDEELKKQRDLLESERKAHLQETAQLKKEYENKISDLENEIANLNSELSGLKELTEKQREELSRMENQALELEKQLEVEISKGEIRLKRFHDRLIINIDDKISFDSGRAALKKNVLPSLNKISKILSQFPEYNIIVEGHTDNVPIKTRRFRNNWHLSVERSLAVLEYLLNKNPDLDPRRFTSAGYSEYRPVVPNDSAENRALNRRVDIVVIPMLKK